MSWVLSRERSPAVSPATPRSWFQPTGPMAARLNLGRTRRDPSNAQRLEIRRRDKGCRFPGCTHTEFTDVHHVRHWVDGGLTDVDNLVELCDQHHRCVHEMGWKIAGNANVELTFQSPTGRRSTSPPPRLLLHARRTAWLIASCSATFCARSGTLTRTSAGVGAAKADSSWDRSATSCTGSPNPRADRADVTGGRRTEELLEHPRLDRGRLGQEGEDPSPAVVEHDEGAGDLRKVDQSRDIVEEGQVAQERHGAGALPLRRPTPPTPSAVDTTPSIPFAPLLARTRGGVGCGLGVPLEVPDRHGGRHQEGRTGLGRVAVDRRGPRVARSGRPPGLRRWRSAPSSRALPRVEPLRIATVSPWRRRRRASDRPRTGGTRSRPAAGRPTAGTGSTTMIRAPAADGVRDVCPECPGEPGRAEQHDALGKRGLGADDGVGGGDRPLEPAAREWVGQDRPTQTCRRVPPHTGRVRPLRPRAPRDDHPPPP